MKRVCISALLILSATTAQAKDCKTIANSAERLACYDSVGKKPHQPHNKIVKPKFNDTEKTCVLNSGEKLGRAIPEARIRATRAALSGMHINGSPEYNVEFDIDMAGTNTTVVFGCIITADGLVVTLPKGRKN